MKRRGNVGQKWRRRVAGGTFGQGELALTSVSSPISEQTLENDPIQQGEPSAAGVSGPSANRKTDTRQNKADPAARKPEPKRRQVQEPTDPLRHAQYLARKIRESRGDPATRRATVRALCEDLVASLATSR